MPYEQWSKNNALLVLDGVADAIVTIDALGTLFYANEAVEAMFGFARHELLGRSLDMLVANDVASQEQDCVEGFIWGGVAKAIGEPKELIAQNKEGEQFAVLLTVNRLESDGAPRYAGIIRDLTAQNERQVSLHAQREQLARAGRLTTVGEMTASIAHEMNQPLTAVAMYAEASLQLIAQPVVNRDKLANALHKLCDQALRAGAVNQRIQQFVRSDNSPREVLNLNRLLEDIRPLAASDARAFGITLDYQLAQHIPQVVCVGLNIQLVILSLLRNAFDAMAEIGCANGTQVSLSTNCVIDDSGSWVQVSVADDGPGIGEDIAGTLFEAFVTSKAQGIGLGLSSCRSLISEEGGVLGCQNLQNFGACFYFSLPAAGDCNA